MRTRLFLIFAASLILLIIFLPSANSHSTLAQGETPAATLATTQAASPDCKPSSVIATANALKSVKDTEKDLTTLETLASAIDAQRIACHGLSFKGTTIAKLIGPFDLPAGTYKVTATTAGYLIVDLKVTKGDCSEQSGLFNLSTGEATTGSETTYTSTGCRILLQPSNNSANWKLTFELLGE